MRKIFLAALLVSFCKVYSQSNEEIISDKICECISQKEKGVINDVINECTKREVIVEAITENYKKKNIKITSDSISKIVDEFNASEGFENAVNRVLSCDAFLILFEKEREVSRLKVREEKTKKQLNAFNEKSLIVRESLLTRAKLNFAYDNYDLALKDVEKIIRFYTGSYDDYLLLAWIYEKQQNYSRALKVYNKLLETEKGKQAAPMILLVKKKMKAKK